MYSIQDMMSDLKIEDCTELTLGGNAALASVTRLNWNVEGTVWFGYVWMHCILYTTHMHAHTSMHITVNHEKVVEVKIVIINI